MMERRQDNDVCVFVCVGVDAQVPPPLNFLVSNLVSLAKLQSLDKPLCQYQVTCVIPAFAR